MSTVRTTPPLGLILAVAFLGVGAPALILAFVVPSAPPVDLAAPPPVVAPKTITERALVSPESGLATGRRPASMRSLPGVPSAALGELEALATRGDVRRLAKLVEQNDPAAMEKAAEILRAHAESAPDLDELIRRVPDPRIRAEIERSHAELAPFREALERQRR